MKGDMKNIIKFGGHINNDGTYTLYWVMTYGFGRSKIISETFRIGENRNKPSFANLKKEPKTKDITYE